MRDALFMGTPSTPACTLGGADGRRGTLRQAAKSSAPALVTAGGPVMPQFAIVDSERIGKDTTYEPPLVIAFGVDTHSVGARTITMGRTLIPPAGRNQAHYHSCEASFFVRTGTLTLFIGDERKEHTVTENQFVYVAPGIVHGLMNASETEPAELIFTYGNCPSKEDAGTVFVEQPWGAASRLIR
jgi:uncharacterized RmlC-like cupin family protein